MYEESDQDQNSKLFKKKLSKFSKNYCLNGKEISKDNPKEYLKEFAAGPCSPIMILPGLLNTKMIVQIDCKTLREENNEIFSSCGWTDCNKEPYEVDFHSINQKVLEKCS